MPPEKVTRKLTKVSIVGQRAFHYFKDKDTGEVLRVPCTDEEYYALGLKDAGAPPTPQNKVWWYSAMEAEFDSVDGDIPPDGYVTMPDGSHLVRLAEYKPYQVQEVKAEEISGDKVDVWQ